MAFRDACHGLRSKPTFSLLEIRREPAHPGPEQAKIISNAVCA
jgi:hypothetical protein